MASDERISDELLLDRLECAWSAQCGVCLNVVNAEVPKVLAELAEVDALRAERDAMQARAERLAFSLANTAYILGPAPCSCEGLQAKVDSALRVVRAALAAAPEARDE